MTADMYSYNSEQLKNLCEVYHSLRGYVDRTHSVHDPEKLINEEVGEFLAVPVISGLVKKAKEIMAG